MEKYIVISDSNKLRAIRKKYNLKQEEVAGKDITKSLLNEIESGKAAITKNIAEIIIKNLKALSKKRKFQINETVEYLLETEAKQASKVLDKYINELKTIMVCKHDSFVDKLKDVEKFLIKWDVSDKKVKVYELAGDYFCNQCEFNKSVVYYEKTLVLIGKLGLSPELLELLMKLSKAYSNAGLYDENIQCCKFVLDNFKDLSRRHTIYFVYNRALALKRLEKYEMALNDIKTIDKLIDKKNLQTYFSVLDTKAVCLRQVHCYDEALEVYSKLLNELSCNYMDKRLITYINIAELYLAIPDKVRAYDVLKVINKELYFLDNDSCYEADIYFELGNIYKELNHMIESNEYYSMALDVAKRKKNYVLAADILCSLIDNNNSIENIKNIEDDVFKISLKQEKLADKLIHKLINFYISNKSALKI